MNRIKTIVIEDEPLARKRLEKLVQKMGALDVVGSFENPTDAIEIIGTREVDLILSDIQMPEMDGITFVKSLDHLPFVIFITGHSEFALEGYELDVLDYILKTALTEERLLKAVSKVRKAVLYRHEDPNNRQSIRIKDRNRTNFIDSAGILYVKAMGDYIQIHTQEAIRTTLCTLGDMEKQLPWKNFVRIHRSSIVNLNYIESIDTMRVVLKNGEELGIGNNYKNLLYNRLGM